MGGGGGGGVKSFFEVQYEFLSRKEDFHKSTLGNIYLKILISKIVF